MVREIRRSLPLVVLAGLAFSAGGWVGARFKPDRWVVDDFARLYHNQPRPVWAMDSKWLGTELIKLPMDLMVFQEIVYEKKPDVLIEPGPTKAAVPCFLRRYSTR